MSGRLGRLTVALLLAGAGPMMGSAQTLELAEFATWDWQLRVDGRGDRPTLTSDGAGIRVRSGAGGIYFASAATVRIPFRVDGTVTQFDPRERREGYGLLLGGSGLTGPEQAYWYFLVRHDGYALVKRRSGERTPVVRDWAPVPGFSTWDTRPAGADSIQNRFTLVARADRVVWLVNDVEVWSVEGDVPDLSGVVGIRVNHGLDVRFDRISVTPLGEGGALAALALPADRHALRRRVDGRTR